MSDWVDAGALLATIIISAVFGLAAWNAATAHIPNFPGVRQINGLLHVG